MTQKRTALTAFKNTIYDIVFIIFIKKISYLKQLKGKKQL